MYTNCILYSLCDWKQIKYWNLFACSNKRKIVCFNLARTTARLNLSVDEKTESKKASGREKIAFIHLVWIEWSSSVPLLFASFRLHRIQENVCRRYWFNMLSMRVQSFLLFSSPSIILLRFAPRADACHSDRWGCEESLTVCKYFLFHLTEAHSTHHTHAPKNDYGW